MLQIALPVIGSNICERLFIEKKIYEIRNVKNDRICSIFLEQIQGIINASKTLLGGEQFVKREVYRWSVTQSYNITQQLQIGIRYFDLRVLYKDLEDKL